MIIDEILDRYDGDKYKVKNFYDYLVDGEIIFFKDTPILKAFDSKDEYRVKKELCWYVISQGYPLDIIKYIMSVNWLKDD